VGKGFKEVVCNEGRGGCGSNYETKSEPHGTATLFSCSEIVFREMSAAQIFIAQHSSRINSAGYSNFPCPYHSLVKVE
jgi:hypothetical protein